jgi:DNA-binding SARP family transcriptional activator
VTVRVWLLGQPRIERDGQVVAPRGRKSWAVLARVALAERPVSRSQLAAELFSDADDPLGALRWCMADLRRCLARPDWLRGDAPVIGPDAVWMDVRALRQGVLSPAEIGGLLLDGAEPRDCPRFDVWLLLARGECAARSMQELRHAALRLLASGDAEAAVAPAGRAAGLDPLDEDAQELFLRVLVAAGHAARAAAHLASCERVFSRAGLSLAAGTRAAARPPVTAARVGVRARVAAGALQRAGAAALDAGSAEAGVETLRRAAEEAERSGDDELHADVLRTLGSALVHAVRGSDGEGAVVLHRALALARGRAAPALSADILRELAFVDLQAGRHAVAERALTEAAELAATASDPALDAAILGVRGMNRADLGRHEEAAGLLTRSAESAARAGRGRQAAWSYGVLARSLVLTGRWPQAQAAAERSAAICDQERWIAFRPWPQALLAQCLTEAGRFGDAQREAEEAFAVACELGDPCWEGMAGRALAVNALRAGDPGTAESWITDARRRCDRVSDRYVWVSGYLALAQIEIAAKGRPDLVGGLTAGLRDHAIRFDLPEFLTWALVHQAEAGDRSAASAIAVESVSDPVLLTRATAVLNGSHGPSHGRSMH